jgi:hypothetical protein
VNDFPPTWFRVALKFKSAHRIFIPMDPGVRRRVVSAPQIKTPSQLQTVGPPPVFELTPEDEPDEIGLSSKSQYNFAFTIVSPGRRVQTVEQSSNKSNIEHMLRSIIRNLHRFHALLILMWADLTLLFVHHPFHTIYFFAKDSSKDIMYTVFTVLAEIYYGPRIQCFSLLN